MDNLKKREIGSEFESSNSFLTDQPHTVFDEGLLTFSGRSALYTVLRDCLRKQKIKRAWLPSYCCFSMIQPFIDNGIPIVFYPINFDSREHCLKRESFSPSSDDLVLSMAYFGFADKEHELLLRKCRETGAVTIEDRTHALLITGKNAQADYEIASLRKWFPIACGGWAWDEQGRMTATLQAPPTARIELRKTAMRDKASFLHDSNTSVAKQAYMDAYRMFNQDFEDVTAGYSIDDWSKSILKRTDLEAIRKKRRENAEVLLSGLRTLPKLEVWAPQLHDEDCPLFVPVMTSKAKQLQTFLASNEIYCPMHWPRPSEEAVSNCYEREVSLICDQRYGKEEMVRILEVLERFCKEV